MPFTKKFFCPANGWDCPYWKKDGSCAIVDEGDNPVKECDDAAYFCEDDENPFCWEDEQGNHYGAQELLAQGYHFVNGEPMLGLEETMKAVFAILNSDPKGMRAIEIKNPKGED